MKSPARARLVRRLFVVVAAAAACALWLAGRAGAPHSSAQAPSGGFRNFESPQVHPLAMTPDGKRLLAVNSPENRLSVFQLTGGRPVLTAEIPVGLEPVSVAARSDREAWVVNWLSDNVSVVDLTTGNVTRTLEVGDEPTDVLFAGANDAKAFVCVSGTMQVKIFDADAPAASAPRVVPVRGKQPRSLARDASGARVFVSVFESGNQTAVVPENIVRFGGGLPPPSPPLAPGLPPAPSTGLVVRWNGSGWVDEREDARWTSALPFRLADVDVAVIDAASLTVSSEIRRVGTLIGNAVYDPEASRLLVANTDSGNMTRFEPNLRGRFMLTRLSGVDPATGASTHFNLNPHIDPANPDGTDAERALSLGLPSDVARASDGTLYVGALGSAKVGVLDASGAVVSRVGVGQGPTGLALDEARSRLYVLNRFEQTVSVVDTRARGETARVPVGFNPEPTEVREGRRFLYDASLSAHGDVSCASCHPGGHRDGMVWDLGNPQGQIDVVSNPGAGSNIVILPLLGTANFHPMKGPMMTQSLRGILETGLLHWRGDRPSFAAFNPAFTGLLGSPRQLDDAEMNAFREFVRTLSYPPNPFQNLNRTFPTTSPSGANAERGRQLFNTARLDGGVQTCAACHQLPTGTNNFLIDAVLLQEPQPFKVPQLRGLYQKTGASKTPGEQITSFGFAHDGTFDSLVSFLRAPVFTFPNGDADRRDVAQFLLSLDTGVAPAVGVQVTAGAENRNSAAVLERINLLAGQALANNCDLVVRGIYRGEHRGFLYDKLTQKFETDRAGEPQVSRQELLDAAGAGGELTFTAVLAGRGRRAGLDTDGDGVLNGDAPRTSVNVSGRVVDAAGGGVAGVTVTLSGSQSATAVTDASGRYLFGYVSTAGTHTVTPFRDGMSFGPASRTFGNPGAHQTADFVAAASAIDSSRFFVSQHYRDFLAREPDAAGLDFWTGGIDSCGADAACREARRVAVSAAFFLSIEFQETGYLVYRTHKASFGNLAGKPVPVTFGRMTAEAQLISQGVVVNQGDWRAQLEANKQAFINSFVERAAFVSRYQTGQTPTQFAAALDANAGNMLTDAEEADLAARLADGRATRASALRRVADDEDFRRAEFNRAFVLMQYFGYLRRNPDDAPEANRDFAGYNFWLGKLEQFNGNFHAAEMVKAFIASGEYRGRFVP